VQEELQDKEPSPSQMRSPTRMAPRQKGQRRQRQASQPLLLRSSAVLAASGNVAAVGAMAEGGAAMLQLQGQQLQALATAGMLHSTAQLWQGIAALGAAALPAGMLPLPGQLASVAWAGGGNGRPPALACVPVPVPLFVPVHGQHSTMPPALPDLAAGLGQPVQPAPVPAAPAEGNQLQQYTPQVQAVEGAGGQDAAAAG